MSAIPDFDDTHFDSPAATEWQPDVPVIDPTTQWLEDTLTETNGPLVVRVWHGTTRHFTTFCPQRGNPEGQFGAMIYCTTDPNDAWTNYALETGADVVNKRNQRQEQILDVLTHNTPDGDMDALEQQATTLARIEVLGENPTPTLMECVVHLTNPFVLGTHTRWAIPGLSAHDDLCAEIAYPDDDDDDAIEAWEAATNAAVIAQHNRIDAAFRAAERALDLDHRDLETPEYLLDERFDGTSADLEQAIRDNFATFQHPETDAFLGSAILAAVVQALGFDSIVLLNAETRFRSMGLNTGVAHVHLYAHTDTTLRVLHHHTVATPVDNTPIPLAA